MELFKIPSHDFDDVYINMQKTKNNSYELKVGTTSTSILFILKDGSYDKEIYLEIWNGEYNVTLLNIAIAFIYETFGKIEIHVFDTFYKLCNDYLRIPLSYYYLANHYVTWFEANFNAQPCLYKNDYDISKKNFKEFILGEKPDFETFCKLYDVFPRMSVDTNRLLSRKESRKNENSKEKLASLYKYSKNIHEFIQKVDRCDNALYRSWLVNLIQSFFKGLLFKTWVIPTSFIPRKYSIQKINESDLPSYDIFRNIEKCSRHSLEV